MAITHILVQAQGTGTILPVTENLTSTANTKLLLHAEDFTDSSASNHTLTNNGSVTIATGKFSNAFLFDKTNYVSVPNSTDFNFAGDFTIDAWFYANTDGTYHEGTIISNRPVQSGNDPGIMIEYNSAGDLKLLFSIGDGSLMVNLVSASAWAIGQWHHVAVVRSGTSLKMYKNGIEDASTTNSTSSVSTYPLYVGDSPSLVGNYYKFDGLIDEVRVLNGQAAWTSNFTPPTLPYSLT